jgi:serine/threonine-protein kinase RsbW
MACEAGGVAPTGVTEVYAAASARALPTIRVVAADLAARADFDLDSIDDLRMAVDEAWAMLARIAAPDAAHNPTLRCRFTVWSERIEVATEVNVDDVADLVSPGSLGWRVLECLTDEVSVFVVPGDPGQPGRVCIVLVKRPVTAQQSGRSRCRR